MARQASKVLSAVELKEQKNNLKLAIKAHDEEIKKVEATFKAAKKAYDEAVKTASATLGKILKETTLARTGAEKTHAALVKIEDKKLADAHKAYNKAKAAAEIGSTKLNDQLGKLNGTPPAAPVTNGSSAKHAAPVAVPPTATLAAPVKRGRGRPRKDAAQPQV